MRVSARLYLYILIVLTGSVRGYGTQFAKGVNYRVGGTPVAVTIGDFNNDGISDLAVASQTSPVGVVILLGHGDGTFQVSGNFTFGKTPSSIVTGDFNGDGDLDLAVVDTTTKLVYVLLGKGDGGFFKPTTQAAGKDPLVVTTSDLTNNGELDLVVVFNGSGTQNGGIAVILGNGDGTFQPPLTFTAGPLPNSLVVGDVNGDGIPDVVAGNDSKSLMVLLGNGDGTFQHAKVYSGLTAAAHSVALGDFNGDGKLDVAAVLGTAPKPLGMVIVGLGNGDGTFAPPTQIGSGPSLNSIAVADFTQNGDLDLAVAMAGTPMSKALVYIGNGDGTFQTAQQYTANADAVALAAADLNGDGYPDLVVVNRDDLTVTVLLNEGRNSDSHKH